MLTLQLETITPGTAVDLETHTDDEPSFETRVILTLALQMLKNDDVLHYDMFRAYVKCFLLFLCIVLSRGSPSYGRLRY